MLCKHGVAGSNPTTSTPIAIGIAPVAIFVTRQLPAGATLSILE
jgi:hypothetical protein